MVNIVFVICVDNVVWMKLVEDDYYVGRNVVLLIRLKDKES